MGCPSLRRYLCSVAGDVLALAELRRRRAEILGIVRKRTARRIAVFGSVARREARLTAIWTCSWTSSRVPLYLITSACSRTLKNSWASESRSSRGASSSRAMTAFAPRP
jgi:hypothetical protein